jgi:glycosyltransferase involved in cell wall biosynthesis
VPIRIGVNALYLIPGEVGGTEIYLRSLLHALAALETPHEFLIYTNAETGSDLVPSAPRFRAVPTGVKARFRPARILYEQMRLPKLLRRDGVAVLLNPGFTAPISFADQSVTVFHDLQHKRHPEFFRWFDLPFWNLLLGAASRSRSLIAVSHSTAADLAHYYPGSRNRIVVIPHGVDAEFFCIGERRAQAVRTGHFLLTVSTLHPHKNIHRLLQAFAAFRQTHPEFRLVVAGMLGFVAESLDQQRRHLRLEDCVTFTGWIPRDELYRLFESASAYIAPSGFEGFGMPLIEALAAGIPTACSAIAPFDEVAGGAAVRFNPDSITEMMEAMRRITFDQDFVCQAVTAGPTQARQFDWAKTARRTLGVLVEVASESGGEGGRVPFQGTQ